MSEYEMITKKRLNKLLAIAERAQAYVDMYDADEKEVEDARWEKEVPARYESLKKALKWSQT